MEHQSAESLQTQIIKSQSMISKLQEQEQSLILQYNSIQQQKNKLQRRSYSEKDKQTITLSNNTIKIVQTPDNKNDGDQKKVQKQLQKELDNLQTKLRQLQNQLKQCSKKTPKSEIQGINQLFQVELQVKDKETQIKNLNQEVRQLVLLKKKQEKVLVNKESTVINESQKVSKFVDELHMLRGTYEKLKILSQRKKEDVLKKKQQAQEMQEKYILACIKNGDKPVSFQQFKNNKKQKLKNISCTSKPKRKQYVSVKEMIRAKQAYDNILPTNQNLMQLRNKKEIAQHALRNAKKKHEGELRQLNQRLQALNQENQTLKIRLIQKQKQKKQVEQLVGVRKKQKGRGTPIV